MVRIFSHLNQEWIDTHVGVNNGAFWYSKELLENIVPKIKTDRGWCLINVDNQCEDQNAPLSTTYHGERKSVKTSADGFGRT